MTAKKRKRGYNVDEADEAFNGQYRRGGGYPVDDNGYERDCVAQMGYAAFDGRILYNAMRDLRLPVIEANRPNAGGGASGFGCFLGYGYQTGFIELNEGERRFTTRVPSEPKLISKLLQNLSAVALLCLGGGERNAGTAEIPVNQKTEGN